MTEETPKQYLARYDAERQAEAVRKVEARERARRETGGDIEALQARLDGIAADIAPLHEAQSRIQAEILALVEEREAAADVLAEVRIAAGAGKPTDWAYLMDESVPGQTHYRAWASAVQALGLHPQGYNKETGQRCASVMLTKGSAESLERTLAGLSELLPHWRAMPDGWIHVGIFEHTLSQSGSYEMLIRPDASEIKVGKVRWGNPVVFQSLETALRHVQDRHWYDGGEREDED